MNAIQNPSPDLAEIERLAAVFRAARDDLRVLATDANSELERVKQAQLPVLRRAISEVAVAESALRDAVQNSSPDAWGRSRTRTFHRVKCGWTKQRGKVVIDDEPATVQRIQKQLPTDQAELLLRTAPMKVHKPAVYDLTASDLKRLGIRISDDTDTVVVKDLASELDRAIESLLAQAAQMEEQP